MLLRVVVRKVHLLKEERLEIRSELDWSRFHWHFRKDLINLFLYPAKLLVLIQFLGHNTD
ncbi:hypothetical protein BpHYR1_028796 [Brachionus plicatilis]|uniref:Uncharacterized protein n=1 Tax=Brachionus plicatilis TaxID=10195 RepID=A0A3M7RCI1_BRAPC|nr:hypothetical protein BpHYR1_028796 [Brachionus plicatilis]